MQSVTVAQPRDDPASETAQGGVPIGGGVPIDDTGLPELSFVHPIPGFPGLRRFVLVSLDEQAEADEESEASHAAAESDAVEAGSDDIDLAVMYELRSLERPAVRFMVAAPSAFFSDYEIEIDDQHCGDLGLNAAEDALILVMLTVGRDASSTTANLLAPVVVNARTRAAAQLILTGSDWPVRAPLG